MRTISIQELKRQLSRILSLAAGGTRVVVTRHKKPIVELTAAELAHVQVGARFGKGRLRPATRRPATRGAYLECLAEDRRGKKSER